MANSQLVASAELGLGGKRPRGGRNLCPTLNWKHVKTCNKYKTTENMWKLTTNTKRYQLKICENSQQIQKLFPPTFPNSKQNQLKMHINTVNILIKYVKTYVPTSSFWPEVFMFPLFLQTGGWIQKYYISVICVIYCHLVTTKGALVKSIWYLILYFCH